MEKKTNSWLVSQYIVVVFFISRFISWDFQIPILQKIYALGALAVSFALVYDYFLQSRIEINILRDKFFLVFLAFFLFVLLVTIINNNSIYQVFSTFYPMIATVCFVSNTIKKHRNELIDAYAIFMFVMIAANFVNVLSQDNSSGYATTRYLLGVQNQYGIIFAIGYLFIELSETFNIYPIKIVYLGLSMISALLMGSSTTLVCIVLLIVLVGIPVGQRIVDKISYKVIGGGYLVGWTAIIVFRLQYLFSVIIVRVLHKNLTFTKRTDVWDVVLEKIKEALLFGHGVPDTSSIFSITTLEKNGQYLTSILSAHNQILQLLYESGIIGLLVLVVIYVISMSAINECKKERAVFYGTVIVVLFNWLTEVPGIYAMILLLAMAFYYQKEEVV